MLAENKHKILDVEGTLQKRREHLARCQMACRELLNSYPKAQPPPPFQETLEGGADSVSARAVSELKKMREADLSVELKLREESRVAYQAQVSHNFADLKAEWNAVESAGDLDAIGAEQKPEDSSAAFSSEAEGPSGFSTTGKPRALGPFLLTLLTISAAILALVVLVLSRSGD